MPDPTPVALLAFMKDTFDLEELKTLCFQLHVPFDDLAGQTREAKARELIGYMDKRGRLPDLRAALARERQERYEQSFGAASRTVVGGRPIRDHEETLSTLVATGEPSETPLTSRPSEVTNPTTISKVDQAPRDARASGGPSLLESGRFLLLLTVVVVIALVIISSLGNNRHQASEATLLPGATAEASTGMVTSTGRPRVASQEESTQGESGLLFDDREVKRVEVPGGSYTMGSEALDGAGPEHNVSLKPFRLDQTEVTNAQYERCVNSGDCNAPGDIGVDYFGDATYAGYPVVKVTWFDAVDYCRWAGGRLPSEAEWEYAARGPDGFTYPWGNVMSYDRLNYNGYEGNHPVAVGSYTEGASWVGALDMAGNVQEWVNDWFAGDYYANAPEISPPGPSSGERRVLRGGWFSDNGHYVRSAVRNSLEPAAADDVTGFRCAYDAEN